MCEATTILAGVGLAISAAGTAYSASAQASASAAQREANVATTNASNTAFWSRLSNEQLQTNEEGTANLNAIRNTAAATSRQQQSQTEATDSKDAVIASENAQAKSIRDQADAQQSQLLGATSGQALAQAQSSDLATRENQVAPIAQNVQVDSPLGDPSGSDNTKQAYAARLAQAADSVRDYGRRVAQVASYTAPLNTVSNSITENASGLLPVALSNQLLQSGAATRILPYTTAYEAAGTEGTARRTQVASDLQSQLATAKNRYDGQESIINLRQNDTTNTAKNQATDATSQAQSAQSLGQMISTLGNLTAYGAGRFSNTGSSGTASADSILAAPSGGGSIIVRK